MVVFKYKDKIYKPENIERKLKKLGITENQITILRDDRVKKEEPKEVLDDSITLHRFDNIINGDYIIGVSESLDHLIWDPINKTGIRDFDPNNWRRIY